MRDALLAAAGAFPSAPSCKDAAVCMLCVANYDKVFSFSVASVRPRVLTGAEVERVAKIFRGDAAALGWFDSCFNINCILYSAVYFSKTRQCKTVTKTS